MKIPYKVGDFIYLKEVTPIQSANSMEYKARIADLSEKAISIELPISVENGRFAFFMDGSILEVTYSSPDGAQYVFQSTILYRRRERIPMILMTYPEPHTIRRIQRRSYLRVPCSIDVAIHAKRYNAFPPFVATTVNLSGGGLLTESKSMPDLKVDTEINWWLALPTQSGQILHPKGEGKIVRNIKQGDTGGIAQYSIQFTNLLERDRESIIKFCFERQLEIKKKKV